MSGAFQVPAAYMAAEIYRGTLVSNGALCPRVEEGADGVYLLDVEVPCGAFGNTFDIFVVRLSFRSGSPVSFSCWLHPAPSTRSIAEARRRVFRLNAMGTPFAVVLDENGIEAVAYGYLPVPQEAGPDLPVSEEMRELSAETDAIIKALTPLASRAADVFADIEEGDGKAVAANALSLDDAISLFDADIDSDPRVVILEDLVSVAPIFLAGSKANTGMSAAGQMALSHACNLALQATHILALAYDRTSESPWRRTWTDLDFKKWGIVSGVFNDTQKQAVLVIRQGPQEVMRQLADASEKCKQMPKRTKQAFGEDVVNSENPLYTLAALFSPEKEGE